MSHTCQCAECVINRGLAPAHPDAQEQGVLKILDDLEQRVQTLTAACTDVSQANVMILTRMERMQPVVDAAVAWYSGTSKEIRAVRGTALIKAISKYMDELPS